MCLLHYETEKKNKAPLSAPVSQTVNLGVFIDDKTLHETYKMATVSHCLCAKFCRDSIVLHDPTVPPVCRRL